MAGRRGWRSRALPAGVLAAAALLALVLVASPDGTDDLDAPADPPPVAGSRPGSGPGSPELVDVVELLRGLPEVDRRPDGLPPYSRDAFGTAWADLDGNGCNQRDDVLLRDAVAGSTRVQPQGACDHDVLAGTWVDPYTARTTTLDDLKDPAQAQAVQIDHVVPLAEAWVSGAAAWDEERRRAFANDLDGLLAVDGPTNASKGSDDPAAWRPRAAYQCAYAVRWVEVKAHWGLGADASEVSALADLLTRCG